MSDDLQPPGSDTVLALPGSQRNPVEVYLERLAEGSVPAMESALNAMADMLHRGATALTLPWARLRYEHTQALRARLIERYKTRTVNRMLAALRGVLREAWKLGQMGDEDYHRAIDVASVPRGKAEPAGRLVTPDEITQLLASSLRRQGAGGARNAALIVVLYAAGLRRMEAALLDVSDYFPGEQRLRVRKGKGGKYRDAYLPREWATYLDHWRATSWHGGPLLPRFNGSGVTSARLTPAGINLIVEDIRTRAGVAPFTPHDLRRSFATTLLTAGADLKMVSGLMGHEDLATTAVYDKRPDAERRLAVGKLPAPAFTPDQLLRRKD